MGTGHTVESNAKGFRLLLIPFEGMPYFIKAEGFGRSSAVKHACALIQEKTVKAVIIYREKKPTQLLVHRPTTYVHIERI